jgi:PAS domain S-box-containing protein
VTESLFRVSYFPDDPIFTRKQVNDEYCRFLGAAPEDLIGRSCLESTPEKNREHIRRKLRYCFQNDAVLVSVESSLKADGSLALIRWIDIPVKDKTGTIVEMLAIGSPMRDRRKNGDRRQAGQHHR